MKQIRIPFVRNVNIAEQLCCKLRSFLRVGIVSILLLSTAWSEVQAQTKQVSGTVTDESGGPMPGVSVQVEGTTTGAITDVNGKYTVSAAQNAVLVFSFLGYNAEKVVVSDQSSIDVKLLPDIKKLDEVVVVGYGSMKKTDITGSTIHVNEAAIREVPSANLQQALQGQSAGLEIQRTGTSPGASAQIRIRGSRSIFGTNDPLYVIDGIPFSGGTLNLNDLNPDDIANIDILKDASATAIYGSRGSNGVILVTTKKGKSGGATVTYNGYYGWGVAHKYPVFSPGEYKAMRDFTPWNLGYQPGELTALSTGQYTDWQDVMYQTSIKTDNNITVSGGSENGTYSLGGGYYKETSVLPGQDFTRYSVRATIDSKVGKKVKVGLSTLNSVGVTNGSQFVAGGSMFPLIATTPLSQAYNSDGSINKSPFGNIDDINGGYSPVYLKHNNNSWVDLVRRLRTFNSLYGEYEFIPGLKYRINLGLNYSQQENDQFQASDSPNAPSFFRFGKGNTASVNNGESWGYTVENQLIFEKTIAKKHRINFTALYSTEEYHAHSTSAQKDSISENFVEFYNLANSKTTPYPTVGGSESYNALISYMARFQYVYDDKYMITLTGRSDGASQLAAGHKWHQFPAVSTGWNITKEQFMKGVPIISNLKLRAGYGQTANPGVNPYSSLGLVSNLNYINGTAPPGNQIRYNFGTQIVTGYNVVTLPNATLDWEYTKSLNLGIDFGLFNNSRIFGNIDYYNTTTDGVLYNVSLPVTSGVAGAYQTNIGSVRNYGFELTISSRNVETRTGFSWTTDLNLFANRNKILALSSGIQQDIANQLFVGHSMTAIYDYKKLGIWQLNEAAQAAVYGSVPGQIKLKDFNNDGKIDSNSDRAIIGTGDANIQGGMTNRFSFKGFDFSFNLYARFGGLLISQIHQPLASYATIMDGRRNEIKVDYWTPSNPTNWFPSPALGSNRSPVTTAWTTLGYYDATFVKLRSVNFGYNFPSKLLKPVGLKSVKLYFTIDNVATLFSPFKKQTGIDPESSAIGNTGVSNPGNIRSNANGNGTVTIGLATPLATTYSVGANISL